MKICIFEQSNEKNHFSKSKIYFHKKNYTTIIRTYWATKYESRTFVRWILTSSLKLGYLITFSSCRSQLSVSHTVCTTTPRQFVCHLNWVTPLDFVARWRNKLQIDNFLKMSINRFQENLKLFSRKPAQTKIKSFDFQAIVEDLILKMGTRHYLPGKKPDTPLITNQSPKGQKDKWWRFYGFY